MRPRPDWRGDGDGGTREISTAGSVTLLIRNEPEVCAPERSGFPSRAGASGSHHLPWALPRVLQVIPKIKRVGPKRSAHRPRTRRCLLKGCERRFHPHQVCQRYCGERCRKAARQWSRWKAQQRYRATTAGKQKRNGQSQRYREHVKSRKPPEPEAVNEAARVITTEHFFRPFLRPAGLLRGIRTHAASINVLASAGNEPDPSK